MRDSRSPARALLTGALRARPRRAATRRPLRAGLPATLLLCSSLCLYLRLRRLWTAIAIAGLCPRAAPSRALRSKCFVGVACSLRSLAKALICCALWCVQPGSEPIIDRAQVRRASARGVSRCVRLSGGSLSDEEQHPIADMDEQRLVPVLSNAQFRYSSLLLRALLLPTGSLTRSFSSHTFHTYCNSSSRIILNHRVYPCRRFALHFTLGKEIKNKHTNTPNIYSIFVVTTSQFRMNTPVIQRKNGEVSLRHTALELLLDLTSKTGPSPLTRQAYRP